MYVELENIDKAFNKFQASDNISFGIEKGKLVGLLGPSGSGKTTILRMIAGLENPDAGDIFIDGKRVNNIAANKRGIGFVFQNYALFRYMTVYDNVAFGLKVRKDPKNIIHERVLELIRLVGLEGMEKRYPHQLSGGQKQRVAFARALAPNPHLLLLDEPFAAIDAKVRVELRGWLREMINRLKITSIFVTHDQDEAIEVADQIIVTNKGKVEQIGSPADIYKNPATPFVAQFMGHSSLLENGVRFRGFEEAAGLSQAVIRPEFVKVVKKGNLQEYMSASEEGRIETISFRGDSLELKVNVNGVVITANRSLEKEELQVGEAVDVLIYRIYAFDGNTTRLIQNENMKDSNSIFI
ncbi:MAG: sulfate/molybdate ABC transporter ATP-binding protein [Lachnospiraceae bacterium]